MKIKKLRKDGVVQTYHVKPNKKSFLGRMPSNKRKKLVSEWNKMADFIEEADKEINKPIPKQEQEIQKIAQNILKQLPRK